MRNIKNSSSSFVKKRSSGSFRNRSGHNTFGPNRRRGVKPTLDIHGFIAKATKRSSETPEVEIIKHTFDDFAFSPALNKNLRHKNYKIPTPIQDQSIIPILGGRDIIGLANTGTGKTAAFLLPMIEKTYNNKSQKVLIIAPTRELALQIEAELRQFSWGMKVFFTSCVGGMPIGKQIRGLKMNPEFVIGTPGRIKDLADRGFIDFSTFNNVILDEVDRMCDMGFINEIRYFLNQLPTERQSLFFSATMPPKIKVLVDSFANNPVTIQVKSQETSANISQEVIKTTRDTKFADLKNLLGKPEIEKVLIFSETKRDVERLSNDLVGHGFKAESIHGDKRQGQRQRALNDFKADKVNILVATDVAARGLDIKGVTHVINYTVPQTYEDYTHRIGRTGRGNALGKALTFVE